MHVLVTGGPGMLGHDIDKDISRQLIPISSYLHPSRGEIDYADAVAVKRMVEDRPIDVVFHCAAFTDVDGCERDPDRAERDNVVATRNVAAAAAERRALMVHISTDYVFKGDATIPISPEANTGPLDELSVYGRTKLLAETEVRKRCSQYLIVRTAWLVGTSKWNFVEAIRSRARDGQPLKVVNDQVGTPTFTFDIAPALLEIARLWWETKRPSKILHMTNEGQCSRYEEAVETLKLDGLDAKLVSPITTSESNRAAKRPKYSVLDNSETAKILGKLQSWSSAGGRLPHWRESLARYLRLRPHS